MLSRGRTYVNSLDCRATTRKGVPTPGDVRKGVIPVAKTRLIQLAVFLVALLTALGGGRIDGWVFPP
jgi:hypothetical protein